MNGQYGFDGEVDSRGGASYQTSSLKSDTTAFPTEERTSSYMYEQEVPRRTTTMVRDSLDDGFTGGNAGLAGSYEETRQFSNQRTPLQSPVDFQPVEETRFQSSNSPSYANSTRPVSTNSLDEGQSMQREKEVFGEHYWQLEQERKQREQSANINDFDMDKRGGLHSASRHRPANYAVADILLWKNVKDSSVVFSLGAFLLFCLTRFSLITLLAYSSLAVLTLAGGWVFVKQMMQTFQKTSSAKAEGDAAPAPTHPFHKQLQREVVIPPDYAHQTLDSVLQPINSTLLRMRNLYLADSLAQTLKLAFFMYILTYVGRWFNLLTLVSIGWVLAFVVPRVYTMYRPQIDGGLKKMEGQARMASDKVMAVFNQQKDKMMHGKNAAAADTSASYKSEVKTTVTVKGKKSQ
ncbi:hypothetical protein RvY_14984 [Ramazzottius varieornatus]|uniref:Reticulon-like protein n=1 Tax=Ramazzottius varieornatus TaxID=947166 RepID=A0A1D1W0C5_RAMVA|nr:hypothetical protein RvY_14984 [Ramazzottius varieornatus]